MNPHNPRSDNYGKGAQGNPDSAPLPSHNTPAVQRFDMVNHPPHYQGQIETIDGIKAALGDAAFIDYCRGQILKYAWRAGKKGDAVEDLKKAAWYANKAAAVIEAGRQK